MPPPVAGSSGETKRKRDHDDRTTKVKKFCSETERLDAVTKRRPVLPNQPKPLSRRQIVAQLPIKKKDGVYETEKELQDRLPRNVRRPIQCRTFSSKGSSTAVTSEAAASDVETDNDDVASEPSSDSD